MAIGEFYERRDRRQSMGRGYRCTVMLSAVGDRVKALRSAAGMTQKELAAQAHSTQRMIAAAETGRTASLLLLVDIAAALDCTLDDLCPVGWDSE